VGEEHPESVELEIDKLVIHVKTQSRKPFDYQKRILKPGIDDIDHIAGQANGSATSSKILTGPSWKVPHVDEGILSNFDVGSIPNVSHDEQENDIHHPTVVPDGPFFANQDAHAPNK